MSTGPSNSIIEQITNKLRSRWQHQNAEAHGHGWSIELIDQTTIDAVARNVASEILHEINSLDETIATINKEIEATVTDINEAIALYFPGLNSRYEESDADHDDKKHEHRDWSDYKPHYKEKDDV